MRQRTWGAALIACAIGAWAIDARASNLTIPTAGRVTVELVSSDADFHNTLAVFSPTVGVAITGCKLEPAGGLTGVRLLSEKTSQRGCRVDLDADPGTAGIQGFAANTTFEFRFCAQTDADDDCEFVWSSDPAQNADNFDHVMTTPIFPGTFPGQIFQLAWEDLENGGDQDFNDLIAVVRVQADSDGDGLWDDWEQFGIDTDGNGTIDLDLPALGADPAHQDVFLEVDYMDCSVAGGDCPAADTHSHEPKTAAVSAVVNAFAAAPINNPDGTTGITLHVDVSTAIAHQNFLAVGCGFPDAPFDAVKSDPANFGPTNPRRFAYHYALFTHRLGATVTNSGCGELPGNDFEVSLGEWNTICVMPGPNGVLNTAPGGDDVSSADVQFIFSGPNLTCNSTAAGDDVQIVANGSAPTADLDADTLDDRTVGTVMQQATTLMHELGHNLQLCHGGEYDPPAFTQCNRNNEPNYLSVMNYSFQPRGIPPTDPDGTGPLTARVDFSPDDLNDLTESTLNEPAGIGNGTDNTRYFCPGAAATTIGAGNGAIDWNCDGDGGTDASVSVDINGDGVLSTLTGFDDWDNLKLDFQNTGDFEDGVHLSTTDEVEMDHLTFLEVPLAAEIGVIPTINTERRGVIPVVICNGGAVALSVTIDDPTSPRGFSAPFTNIVLDTIRFAVDAAGNPLGSTTAPPAHRLSRASVLGEHLTEFVDTNGDGQADTLVPLDSPRCPGAPAGPDLVVHFRQQLTGLTFGDSEACASAQLTDGSTIIGCDDVTTVK